MLSDVFTSLPEAATPGQATRTLSGSASSPSTQSVGAPAAGPAGPAWRRRRRRKEMKNSSLDHQNLRIVCDLLICSIFTYQKNKVNRARGRYSVLCIYLHSLKCKKYFVNDQFRIKESIKVSLKIIKVIGINTS